jgi:uncharacterized membrane protein YgcG
MKKITSVIVLFIVIISGCASIPKEQVLSGAPVQPLKDAASSDTLFDQFVPDGSESNGVTTDAYAAEPYYYPYNWYSSLYYGYGPYPYYYDPFYCSNFFYDPLCMNYNSLYAPYYYGYPYPYYYVHDDDDDHDHHHNYHHRYIKDVIDDWNDSLGVTVHAIQKNIKNRVEDRRDARRELLESLQDRAAELCNSLQERRKDNSIDALDIAQRMQEVRQHQLEAVRNLLNNHDSHNAGLLNNHHMQNSFGRAQALPQVNLPNQGLVNNHGFMGNQNSSFGDNHGQMFGNGANSGGIFGGGGGFSGWGGRR